MTDATAPTSPPTPEIDLGALLKTLWRGRWIVALVTAAFVAVGAFYAFRLAEPVYTATATVALVEGEPSIVDFASVVPGLSSDQSTINTEIEVIRSRGLLERLIDRLDLLTDPEFNPAAASLEWGLRDLLGDWIPALAPAPPEPLDDTQILDRTVDRLLESISVVNIRQSLVFRITADTDAAAKSALVANTLAELYIADQITAKLEATESATEWLSGRMIEMRDEFETVQDRLQDFTAETEVVSPEELSALNRQLADLRRRYAAAETRVANASGTVLDRARIELAALADGVADLEERILARSGDLSAYQTLEREVAQYQAMFEYFQIRLRETAVQQGIQQADARMLSRAAVPIEPSSPRKPLILALSLVLGAMGGAALVLGGELRHTGLRTIDELEAATGATVMAMLPRVRAKGRRPMLEDLQARPTSRLAEAFRNLRTSILRSALDRKVQVIMSTSSLPGEGKTTQSMALAQSFGQMGRRVLVVECDLRRRTLSAEMGFSDEFGLAAVLAGEAELADALQRDEATLPGVDVLVGDRGRMNPVDLFSSRRFAEFLGEMRERYDVVVLDTPPVHAVPEARVIGAEADAVLYAVKWNDTPRSVVRDGLRLLETANVHVSGLVLTQVDVKALERYGGDRYSRYGDSYYDT